MTNKPWQEELKGLGKLICSCGVYDDGECPRFERLKQFISELSKEQFTAGYKQGREDAIEETKREQKSQRSSKK